MEQAETPTETGLVRMDRNGLVMGTHIVLSEIRDYIHGRFGASVGPVWVTPVRTDPADDDENGQTKDVFQIRFGLTGRTETVLMVPTDELVAKGVDAIGEAHARIMGSGR